jgi:hypothetical protein
MVGAPDVVLTPCRSIRISTAVFTAIVVELLQIFITEPVLLLITQPVGILFCVAEISRLGGTDIERFIFPATIGEFWPAVPAVAFTVAFRVPLPARGTSPELSTSIFRDAFWAFEDGVKKTAQQNSSIVNLFFILKGLMFYFITLHVEVE